MDAVKNLYNKDKNMGRLLIVMVALFGIFSALKGNMFLSVSTFQSMGRQFPEYGILAIAMAMAMFTGGIDLSILYIATLSSVVIAKLLPVLVTEDMGTSQIIMLVLLCYVIAILVGALCGVLNGLLISLIGIPPILATLGTQSLFWGISLVLTGGSTLSGFPVEMSNMINADVAGIPVTVILFFVCAVIVGFILSKTTLGYKLRMLGTNPIATKYAGLNNVALYTKSYMMSGMLAAVTGIIMIGRFNSAKADYGASYTMQSIMIAVLGGISPSGGRGNVKGVVVAVIITQMVSTWLNMYENISNFYRQIVWGALLIFVLILNHYINKRETKLASKK